MLLKLYLVLIIYSLSGSGDLYSGNDSLNNDIPVLYLNDSLFRVLKEDESFPDPYFYYVADTAETLKIEEVSSPGFSGKFIPVPYDSSGGVHDSLVVKSKVFWLRLRVKNVSNHIGEWWFDTGGGKKASLFVKKDNRFINKSTGFKFPLKDRDIKLGEEYLLSLFLSRDTVQDLYFREEFLNESRLIRPEIVDKSEFIEDDRRDRYIQGAFFGLLIIIALYNLLLYFFVKEISNIYYSLYLFCITISYLSTSGYGFELFWPGYPGNFIWIITLGWATAGFFYVLFGRAYLHTAEYLPKWNRILKIHLVGSVFAWFFILCSVIYLNYHDMIGSNNVSVDSDSSLTGIFVAIGVILTVVWIFLAFFIVLIPSFYCLKKKYQPAKYFLYASISLAVGILVQIFGDSENIITDNAFQFGVAVQAIFFSLGLGYRIDLLRKEKQKAQADALVELEQKVQERTFELVKQKEIVEDKQKEIIDSITYAKRLQEAILPPVELIRKFIPESFVLYQPKDIVAGDFYWMERSAHAVDGTSVAGERSDGFVNSDKTIPEAMKDEDEALFIAVADCTGHGVPGAMVSVVCSNALNRAIKEFGLKDTGKILDKVTDLVLETFEKSSSEVKDGMDISLLKIDPSTENGQIVKCQWSGANNPLWYFSNGALIEIKADKQPVGKFYKRKPFSTHEIEVRPGADGVVFYLFTDGFADQFGGPKKKKFMYKRLEEKIIFANSGSFEQQKEILLRVFNNWKGNIEQLDDVTVLGIKL